MRAGYEQITSPDDVQQKLGGLAAKTVIVDVEPWIATWDGSQDDLDRGLELLLDQVEAVPGLLVVCVATNSARLPSALPARPGIEVSYVASARKPLRTAPYARLPRPGAVIGDQILTDGLLAWRMGYTFLHYRPPPGAAPIGPTLLHGCGHLLRPLLFSSQRTSANRP